MPAKNGVMIAPKRERSTGDVVQLARQKVDQRLMGTIRSYLYLVVPDYRAKDSISALRRKERSRQAFNRKFFDIVFIAESNVRIKRRQLLVREKKPSPSKLNRTLRL